MQHHLLKWTLCTDCTELIACESVYLLTILVPVSNMVSAIMGFTVQVGSSLLCRQSTDKGSGYQVMVLVCH